MPSGEERDDLARRSVRAKAALTGTRRELIWTIAILSALVIARSFVYAAYEQSYFDSDQAIVGLMAKHLSEGRAFPLFFYGQAYMLAVEAWWMVPFFWIGGPTVAALRASLIATNIAIVALLIVGLVRWGGLRPWMAGLASAFFVLAPPVTAAFLVEAQGGNVEPFFWVLVLWFVRRRPLVFGAILAIAFLNREFSIYAVPVLLAGDLLQRRFFRVETVRHWMLAATMFVLVIGLVHSLTPYADLTGPGTRGQIQQESQVENLTQRMSLQGDELVARVVALAGDVGAGLLGAREMTLPFATQGRNWLFWPVALALLAVAIRVIVVLRDAGARQRLAAAPFGAYVASVGVAAAAAVLVLRPATGMPPRYLLLTLLIPIGVTAVLFLLEPRTWVRRATIAGVLLWTAFSAVDHARLAARYASGQEANPLRVLADALVARGVTVTEANYWRAYKLTFLAREAVKVGSIEFARIAEYQWLASLQGDKLRQLSERPCDGGEPIEGWFLCPVPR